MNVNLEQLEARLKALIEVRLVSTLPGFQVEDLVVQKLADSLKNNIEVSEDGTKNLPNVFTLVVHPKSAERWHDSKFINAMINSLTIVAEEAGLTFTVPPTISIVENSEQSEDQIAVLASRQLESEEENTQGLTPTTDSPASKSDETPVPRDAFLIIDGVKVFPLTETVINIGRRLDNQLVIDDPRISRNHAQLRAINRRYIIFDLNSTGGTFVNAQRTSQSVLYPGDVISLAGVPLVFGQDNPPTRRDLAKTDPLFPASLDRPTAFFRDTGEFDNKDKNQE